MVIKAATKAPRSKLPTTVKPVAAAEAALRFGGVDTRRASSFISIVGSQMHLVPQFGKVTVISMLFWPSSVISISTFCFPPLIRAAEGMNIVACPKPSATVPSEKVLCILESLLRRSLIVAATVNLSLLIARSSSYTLFLVLQTNLRLALARTDLTALTSSLSRSALLPWSWSLETASISFTFSSGGRSLIKSWIAPSGRLLLMP
mmetsp:Transcript_3920/g.11343  ORF Transcript_3920/g.11343 Transcript_3920/m.11343 type:complete len:205 (-) Transcript_3920:85-699(-)